MSSNSHHHSSDPKIGTSDPIDLRKILIGLIKFRILVVAIVSICLVAGFWYKYFIFRPRYKMPLTVLLSNSTPKGLRAYGVGFNALMNLTSGSGIGTGTGYTKKVVTSWILLESVAKKTVLQEFRIRYFKDLFIVPNEEVFSTAPFRVRFEGTSGLYPLVKFSVEIVDKDRFRISLAEELNTYRAFDYQKNALKNVSSKVSLDQTYRFGETISLPGLGSFHIDRVAPYTPNHKRYSFRFRTFESMMKSFKSALTFPPSKSGDILNISYEDVDKYRAIQILNQIPSALVRYERGVKNVGIEESQNLLRPLMLEALDTLKALGREMIRFQESEDFVEGDIKARGFISQVGRLDVEFSNIRRKEQYLNYLKDYLDNDGSGVSPSNVLAPSVTGLESGSVLKMYNQMVELSTLRAKNGRFQGASLSPSSVDLTSNVELAKNTLYHNIEETLKSTKILKDDVKRDLDKGYSTMRKKMPKVQYKYAVMSRELEFLQTQYQSYWLRYQTLSIQKLNNNSDTHILDRARDMGEGPYNSSSTKYVLIGSFFVGLVLSMLAVVGIDFIKVF